MTWKMIGITFFPQSFIQALSCCIGALKGQVDDPIKQTLKIYVLYTDLPKTEALIHQVMSNHNVGT